VEETAAESTLDSMITLKVLSRQRPHADGVVARQEKEKKTTLFGGSSWKLKTVWPWGLPSTEIKLKRKASCGLQGFSMLHSSIHRLQIWFEITVL
jgi:hypothetical protein